jgi:hypothetical protein
MVVTGALSDPLTNGVYDSVHPLRIGGKGPAMLKDDQAGGIRRYEEVGCFNVNKTPMSLWIVRLTGNWKGQTVRHRTAASQSHFSSR